MHDFTSLPSNTTPGVKCAVSQLKRDNESDTADCQTSKCRAVNRWG